MSKYVIAVAASLFAFAGATSADARPSREINDAHWNPFVQHSSSVAEGREASPRAKRSRVASQGRAKRVRYASRGERSDSGSSYNTNYQSGGGHSAGGRPRAWCGWWMRTQRGGGPEMNLAWNWSRWGSPSGPQVGAVVVWRHHVGEIVGRASNGQWLVRSGNDGGAVRTRARSVSGAVFRVG
jgi:hypothetical protein